MKKLRAGIVGCGGIANAKHLPAMEKCGLYEVVAFCDIIPEQAQETKEKFGSSDAKVFTDYRELVKEDLDVVYVTTPNRSHSEISIAAMEAGKDVMCEKPMARTYAETEKMLETAKRTGRVLNIAYQNRYRPDSAYLKEMCKNGEMGDIYFAKAHALRRRAVIGGGNTALQDAEFLSNYCNKVYVVHRRDEFRGESNLVDVLKEKDNVEFVLDSIVKDIEGKFMVERLFLRNKKTGQDFHIPVSGVFVAIGQIPQNEIFDGLVRLDENGFILASEDCMTSHPGIFAAGDCRTKEVRQLTTAAADGSVAALAACKYLSMNF